MTHIYGVVTKIKTEDAEHGRTWCIKWLVKHSRLIYPDFTELDHHENDLIIVKYPKDNGPDGDFDLESLSCKANDTWKLHRYNSTCEFCNNKCDRLIYMDDWV